MKSLGIDLGAVTVKAVLLDENLNIIHQFRKKRETGLKEELLKFIGEVEKIEEEVFFGLTGFEPSKEFIPSSNLINNIFALVKGVTFLHPDAKNILEIGGHSSKILILSHDGEILDFQISHTCAAGTGAFLEQQAKRLGISVEELSEMALKAKKGARIAGRCAVFAKSDMIHHQQKGTPPEEIAYGLCLSICRNIISNLLKGGGLNGKTIVAGGCSYNKGILRAIKEILSRDESKIFPSSMPGLEPALGSALIAYQSKTSLKVRQILDVFNEILTSKSEKEGTLPPLPYIESFQNHEPQDSFNEYKDIYIGIDIGSVSTDFVALDREGNVLTSIYLPTRGRPVEVILEGLKILKSRFKKGVNVLGCGVTGSGRYLAEKLVGADSVKNEITCQMLGATKFLKDVDTIFEIGGQDSKYIYVKDGRLSDFTMNKICSAGTGSFIEEQASELGIDVYKDFSERAFQSKSPSDLGSRCTVFMETDVFSKINSGSSLDDICAGLAYSIAKNYLEKVVAGKKIGNFIVMQGGVASNKAVVSAFESLLGKKIHVHPYNRLSGAIGSALSAMEAVKDGKKSKFRWPEENLIPTLKSFNCKKCSNNCEVNVILKGGEKFFFGDICERYTSAGVKSSNLPNFAREFMEECEKLFNRFPDKESIGIPRSSALLSYLPFFATFFSELGFNPVLSPPSSEEILSIGSKYLPSNVCLPVKISIGHAIKSLQSSDLLFFPAIYKFHEGNEENSYSCPYTQALPFMGDFGDKKVLSPVLSMREEEFLEGFKDFMENLDISQDEIREAYRKGMEFQIEFERRFKERIEEFIRGRDDKIFVVMGRPYNIFDPFLNLNLFEQMRKLGLLAVPAFLLFKNNGETEIPWFYPSRSHVLSHFLSNQERFVPILLSNFGCAPDAFTFRHIENNLKGKPYLILEFDEHRAETGMITRIEAFIDQLNQQRGKKFKQLFKKEAGEPEKGEKILIPYFADSVYAYSGLWRLKGYDVEILPLPDWETASLGEAYSYGKECHAFPMLLGDLLKSINRKEKTVFTFPGTTYPCMLHQFPSAMQKILDEIGVENSRVYAPKGEDFFRIFGFEGCVRYYRALFAIDILTKALCRIRPYEKEKGGADKIHKENLLMIEEAILTGEIYSALEEGLKRLSKIPLKSSERFPLVGVAGDIYTRINPSANQDLFHWLEEKGIEVIPAPFQIDVLDFDLSHDFYTSLKKMNPISLLPSAYLFFRRDFEGWFVKRKIKGFVKIYDEPGYREIIKIAKKYMGNLNHKVLLLNVAKMVDFARKGADGIINAICFNCMIGNSSSAISGKIRRDFGNIPILTAIYSTGDEPSRKIALETFVEQVKRFHELRNLMRKAQ
jgi:predicted CoA-substrate-specific enzyme activase